jgi:hypothetical protein
MNFVLTENDAVVPLRLEQRRIFQGGYKNTKKVHLRRPGGQMDLLSLSGKPELITGAAI